MRGFLALELLPGASMPGLAPSPLWGEGGGEGRGWPRGGGAAPIPAFPQRGKAFVRGGIESQVHVQALIGRITRRRVLGVGAGRVVALAGDLPAHAVPHLLQVVQAGAEDFLGVAPDAQFALPFVDRGTGRARLADGVAPLAQAVRAQHLHHRVALGGAHLQHHAQLFTEQRFQRQLLASRADLAGPVLGVAVLGAAVADAVAFGHQHVHVQRHADAAGKGHLGGCGQQAAVAAVVVGKDLAFGAQLVDGRHQRLQVFRAVQIGHAVFHRAARLAQRLRQHAAGQAVPTLAQIDQHQRRVLLAVELRRQRAAHVGQRCEGADDQADGRSHLLRGAGVLPLRAHRQAVLADRDRHIERRAQFHAHGLDGGVQRRVLTRFAAGGHPVGGKFHARQLDGRRQQVGDGLGHRHAAGCGRIQRGQRRALAHAHGLAGKALEIGQRHRAIGHRHLPGADHLVAVRQAAHGAVADGDEEALAGDGGVAQHLDHGVLQGQAVQIQRCELALHGRHVAVHLGRLAQQHVHGHVHGRITLTPALSRQRERG